MSGALPSGAAPPLGGPEIVWRDNDGQVAAIGWSDGGRHRLRMPGVAEYVWADGQDDVHAAPAPDVGRPAVAEAFHRCVLPLALQTRGVQVLHASAVRGPGGVVALCARSGTGKSTLACGLGRRPGHALWADDALAFEVGVGADAALAVPLPFSLHLRPASASYFGARPATPTTTAAAEAVPLAHVVVLERAADGEPAVAARRLSDAEAFTGVLAHAYCFDLDAPALRRMTAERYLALVARVPVHALRFRPGLDAVPALVEALEDAARWP